MVMTPFSSPFVDLDLAGDIGGTADQPIGREPLFSIVK